jgi:hypothetical protein
MLAFSTVLEQRAQLKQQRSGIRLSRGVSRPYRFENIPDRRQRMVSGHASSAPHAHLDEQLMIRNKKNRPKSAILANTGVQTFADARVTDLIRSAAEAQLASEADAVSVSRAILRWRIRAFSRASRIDSRQESQELASNPRFSNRNDVRTTNTGEHTRNALESRTKLIEHSAVEVSAEVPFGISSRENGKGAENWDRISDASTVIAIREIEELDVMIASEDRAPKLRSQLLAEIDVEERSLAFMPMIQGRRRRRPVKPIVYPEFADAEEYLPRNFKTTSPSRSLEPKAIPQDAEEARIDESALTSSSSFDSVFGHDDASASTSVARMFSKKVTPVISSHPLSFQTDEYLTFSGSKDNKRDKRDKGRKSGRNRFMRWASKTRMARSFVATADQTDEE